MLYAKACDAIRQELKCTFCYAVPFPFRLLRAPESISVQKNISPEIWCANIRTNMEHDNSTSTFICTKYQTHQAHECVCVFERAYTQLRSG